MQACRKDTIHSASEISMDEERLVNVLAVTDNRISIKMRPAQITTLLIK